MAAPALSKDFGYDPVARIFHWLTAFLIFTAIALGLLMTRMPGETEAQIAEVIRLYSIHKTLGVAMFFVALGRIIWAATHRRPGHLHPDRRAETFLADLTHWSLYGAMLVMPLSGWLYHSTADAFAPILWPFGQSLPFVERSERLAYVFGTIHHYAAYALYAAIAVHLAGAFKHAIVDMDATFARMTSGLGTPVARARLRPLPALVALALWSATIAYGVVRAPEPEPDPFADIEEAAAP